MTLTLYLSRKNYHSLAQQSIRGLWKCIYIYIYSHIEAMYNIIPICVSSRHACVCSGWVQTKRKKKKPTENNNDNNHRINMPNGCSSVAQCAIVAVYFRIFVVLCECHCHLLMLCTSSFSCSSLLHSLSTLIQVEIKTKDSMLVICRRQPLMLVVKFKKTHTQKERQREQRKKVEK